MNIVELLLWGWSARYLMQGDMWQSPAVVRLAGQVWDLGWSYQWVGEHCPDTVRSATGAAEPANPMPSP